MLHYALLELTLFMSFFGTYTEGVLRMKDDTNDMNCLKNEFKISASA